MGSLFVLPVADVGSGIKPSDGAKLFFFDTGTGTPKNTYNCPDLSTAHSNPVIADAAGVFPAIWVEGQYKVILKDKNDNQIWEEDPVSSYATEESIAEYDYVEDMTAESLPIPERLIILKSYSATVSSGILYFITKSGTGTDDGGSVINHDSLTFRYEQIFPNALNPKMWGADHSAVADSTTAIANMIAYAYTSGLPIRDHWGNQYRVSKPNPGSDVDIFKITASVDIEGLSLIYDMSDYVDVNTSTTAMHIIDASDVRINRCRGEAENAASLNFANAAFIRGDWAVPSINIDVDYNYSIDSPWGITLNANSGTGAVTRVSVQHNFIESSTVNTYSDGIHVEGAIYDVDYNFNLARNRGDAAFACTGKTGFVGDRVNMIGKYRLVSPGRSAHISRHAANASVTRMQYPNALP